MHGLRRDSFSRRTVDSTRSSFVPRRCVCTRSALGAPSTAPRCAATSPVPARGLSLLAFAASWLCICSSSATEIFAARPHVRFDTPYLVACRELVPQGEGVEDSLRMVEAKFQVSSLVQGVDSGDVKSMQFVHRFLSPEGKLQVVDFAPRSEFTSRYVGNIGVDQNQEKSASLGVNLSGSFEHLVTGSAGTDLGSKSGTQLHYELKPPTEPVLAAGTLQRGTGVYFKVRPAADSPLEGVREFIVRMRVDAAWRGGLMYVHSVAQQRDRGKVVTLSSALYVVTLYAAGDQEVLQAGQDLIAAEADLRRAAAAHEKEVARRSLPTLVHRLGAVLDVYEPRIPDHWLERLIFGPADIERHEFAHRLPDELQKSAQHFAAVKQRIVAFGT
jgi:hypothetical protein